MALDLASRNVRHGLGGAAALLRGTCVEIAWKPPGSGKELTRCNRGLCSSSLFAKTRKPRAPRPPNPPAHAHTYTSPQRNGEQGEIPLGKRRRMREGRSDWTGPFRSDWTGSVRKHTTPKPTWIASEISAGRLRFGDPDEMSSLHGLRPP